MEANEINREAVAEAASFVGKFNNIILEPFIYLLMALAFLVFVWGVAQYVYGAAVEDTRKKGRRHMIWGLFGLFVMVSAWSILSIVTGTFALDDELDCARTPSGTGCETKFQVDTTPLTDPN